MRTAILIAILAATAAGCESDTRAGATTTSAGKKPIEVDVVPPKGAITSEQFDLEATAALVRDDRVKDGKTLEARINKHPRNKVDTDGDGKRDRLQVVEHRGEASRSFEVRAIPSSKAKAKPEDVAIDVAVIEVLPFGDRARVTVEYAPTVIVAEPVEIAFEVDVVVGSFCHWVLVIDRPVFVGVAYVIIHEHSKHKKHKHKKHKKH